MCVLFAMCCKMCNICLTQPLSNLLCVFTKLPVPLSLSVTPNPPTIIVDFRGFDSSIILILRGGIPTPIGDFPGKFESSNVSGDNVSRGIGRIG